VSQLKPLDTEIRNGSVLEKGDGSTRKAGNSSTEKRSLLGFAEWLHGLECDAHLLLCEAKTSRNVAWCKGVLARWKEAGYPDPSQWPETRQ
jgi:hypothetical protein